MVSGRLVDRVVMPARVARLPRNAVGYPIPWFVAELDDGSRDFRIASADRMVQAVKEQLCWVCGGRRGAFAAFTVGPMCAVNRISGEPPSHRDCAVYSARVCPFLATPAMRRRDSGKDGRGFVPAAGAMLERNPGVALVWVTRQWRAFHAPAGNKGLLFSFRDPTEVLWFAGGEPASRAAVLASFEAGLPVLREACQRDANPAASLRDVERSYARALLLAPA